MPGGGALANGEVGDEADDHLELVEAVDAKQGMKVLARGFVSALGLRRVPIELAGDLAYRHLLEVGEREQASLVEGQLLDRLMDSTKTVLVQCSVLRAEAGLVFDRLGFFGRHDTRRASLGFQQALGSSPGAGDQPARRLLDMDAFGELAAVFERGGGEEVLAVGSDELRREALAAEELDEAQPSCVELALCQLVFSAAPSHLLPSVAIIRA